MNLYENNGYLKLGSYRRRRYVMAVRNRIPCCYVEVTKERRKRLDGHPVSVHGGVSFEGTLGTISGWWIGWDYGHPGDYIKGVQSGVRWTEEDLEAHCKAAIIQLESL